MRFLPRIYSVQRLLMLEFPSALPSMMTGFRTASGLVVVGAIIGEYLGASAGLGYLIAQAEGNFNAVGVFAGIIILAAFVLFIDALLDLVQNRVLSGEAAARAGTASTSVEAVSIPAAVTIGSTPI